MLGERGRRASQRSHSDKRREKEICDRNETKESGNRNGKVKQIDDTLFLFLSPSSLAFSSVPFTAPLFFLWICNQIWREREWIYNRGLKLKFWEGEEDDHGRWFRKGYGRLWFVTGVLIFTSDEKCMWRGREGSWPLICCVIDGSCFILRD